tara:strand:+ start:29475 stop:30608 length:1134 start_codon:yes stop_codon:yes gene_type:complete
MPSTRKRNQTGHLNGFHPMRVNLRRSFNAAKPSLARNALMAIYASGAHRMAPKAFAGVGVIFMLHRVCENTQAGFAPNRILEITPEFLESVIGHVRERGYTCVSLDEAVTRIIAGETAEKFAVFTLDDGYLDNLTVAAPIFTRHNVPFTVYLATSLPDETAELWWVALERIIAKEKSLTVAFPEGAETFSTQSDLEKYAAWESIYWRLRALGETALRTEIRRLAAKHDLNMKDITRELAMSWDEVRALASTPFASVEAHTANHIAMAHLSDDEARGEIAAGVARHEMELGSYPRHFSYPYGDPTSASDRDFEIATEFGFRSATTTRKGLIQPHHADRLARLPRLSLNGDYQDLRLLDVLLSGLPFALAKAAGSSEID